MSKDNPALNEIPNLYKKQALHLIIYGFITGVQTALPSITRKEAAEMYLKRFRIKELDSRHVERIHERLNADALDLERTNGKED